MTEHQIIFSAPMVRALLDDLKTQTRRVLKLPTKTHSGGAIYEHPKMGGWEPTTVGGGGCFTIGKGGERIPEPEKVGIWHRTCGTCIVARYQPGDRLWVRETWMPAIDAGGSDWRYAADYDADGVKGMRELQPWRPSIHMPRRASRLTLIVTDVRVQRLQEISEEDAQAEGIRFDLSRDPFASGPMACWYASAIDDRRGWNKASAAFRELWESIHGSDAWEGNPWVVALTFTVHRSNIDALPAESEAA